MHPYSFGASKPSKAMSALFLLIGVSLVFAFGFLGAFLWAMNDRQFEDDHTPAVRMLFDDKMVVTKANPPILNSTPIAIVEPTDSAIKTQ